MFNQLHSCFTILFYFIKMEDPFIQFLIDNNKEFLHQLQNNSIDLKTLTGKFILGKNDFTDKQAVDMKSYGYEKLLIIFKTQMDYSFSWICKILKNDISKFAIYYSLLIDTCLTHKEIYNFGLDKKSLYDLSTKKVNFTLNILKNFDIYLKLVNAHCFHEIEKLVEFYLNAALIFNQIKVPYSLFESNMDLYFDIFKVTKNKKWIYYFVEEYTTVIMNSQYSSTFLYCYIDYVKAYIKYHSNNVCFDYDIISKSTLIKDALTQMNKEKKRLPNVENEQNKKVKK